MQNPIHSPRAYSYIRFSSAEQRKGDSFRRQLELSKSYAEAHSLVLDEKLTFMDLGVSAYDQSNLGESGQLRAFLDATDKGYVPSGSYLLVESLDRLSRAKILDALNLFTGILQKGINIVTLADGHCYNSENVNEQFAPLLISITIMSRAHEESKTKSLRLKASWENKRKNAAAKKLTKHCPAWLKLSDDRSKYIVIEEHATLVKKIISQILNGQGKTVIAKALNQEQIPSIGGKAQFGTWHESYITKIIKNRALIGEFQPHRMENGVRVPYGDPIPDYFPAIIDEETFLRVQDTLAQRATQKTGGNHGKNFSNLFMGLLKCGYCGGSMVYVDKGIDKRAGRLATPGYNRFVVCGPAKRGHACDYISWQYDDLEMNILAFIEGVSFSDFVKVSSSGERLNAIKGERLIKQQQQKELQKKVDALVNAIESALAGDNDPPRAILERIAQNEQALEQITAELLKLDREEANLLNHEARAEEARSEIGALIEKMHSTEGEGRATLRAKINEHLRYHIERIKLFPGGPKRTLAPEEVEALRQQSLAAGHDKLQVEESIRHLTRPLGKTERSALLRSRNGQVQVITPQSHTPSIVIKP